MKKNIVILTSFVLNIALLGIIIFMYKHSNRHMAVSYTYIDTYSYSNKEHKDRCAGDGSSKKYIVFIGNSITQNWAHTDAAFFSDNNYLCRGIGGQSSMQMLLRLRKDVIELKPVAVVINAGTNDIAEADGFYRPDITLNNIKSMAEIAAANDIKVVLTSVLPAGEYTQLFGRKIKDVPLKIAELNVSIKLYANDKGFDYIDYNTAMRDNDGSMRADLSIDGVHPSRDGYDVMKRLLKPTLDSLQTIIN